MKKRTRILAMLMAWVMTLNCLGGLTVLADEVDVTCTCGHCTDSGDETWIAINQDNIGTYTKAVSNAYYFYDKDNESYDGNFYLTSDLYMDVTLYAYEGKTVTLCLNGYNIISNDNSGVVLNLKENATLNLYGGSGTQYYNVDTRVLSRDCDADAVELTGGAVYGAVCTSVGGGTMFLQEGSELNLYGGNLVGGTVEISGRLGGGLYNYEGTVNMYGGTILGNRAEAGIAGGVYNRENSVFNMYGGEIAYNYSATYGGGLYNAGTFNMYGGSIHDNDAALGGGGISTIGTVNLSSTSETIFASIDNNTAGGRCGGVFIASSGSLYGSLHMSGYSTVTENHSGGNGSGGVGIIYATNTLTMTGNASITGNTTTGASAGVGYTLGTFKLSGNASVTGNTVVNSSGETLLDSNAYLLNSNVIEVTDYFTGSVGITTATGVGTVVVTGEYADNTYFTSDNEKYYPVQVGETVELQAAAFVDGADVTMDYAQGTIDVSDLEMFDFDGITSTPVYTVTPVTGAGTLSGSDLSVSKVGTFTVEVYTPACNTAPPTTQTATLTVEPITVYITNIATVGNVIDGMVEIDNTKGTLTGDVNNDDVSIDYTVAYATMNDAQYDADLENEVDTDGKTYTVKIHDISITGDDAGNYVLGSVNDGEGATVTIKYATPYISWPTAEDITYGTELDSENLLGGQVMVKYNNTWYDLAEFGTFQWAASVGETLDAGTYAIPVKFVFNDEVDGFTTADAETYKEYVDAVEGIAHNVTQVVHMAEATVTITDHVIAYGTEDKVSIVVKDENKNVLTEEEDGVGDYRLYFATYTYNEETKTWGYSYDMDWSKSQDIPTDVGSYLIAVDFTEDSSISPNYVHAGTMESYAKQVGSMVIWGTDEEGNTQDEPTTYTVTFEDGEGVEIEAYAISGATEQDIHILPTLTGFAAWETTWGGETTTYDFGSRFPQPAHDVVFKPVESPDAGTITGTITGTSKSGVENSALIGVVVALIQGPDQIAITSTDEYGYYEFEDVPQGRYDLVVTRDYIIRNEETIYLELIGEELEVPTVDLPDTRQNTIFNVAAGMTAITVEGMKDLIDGTEEIRSIKLELSTAATADTQEILTAVAYDLGLSADNCKYFIDLSILERKEDATGYGEIASLGKNASGDNELLTFYVPLAGIYQGYDNYVLYRDNGEYVEIIDTTKNNDGEIMSVTASGDLLTMTVQKTGIYGLAFYDTVKAEDELVAETKTTTYTTEAIDINEIFSEIESDGARTYVIKETTGQGTIDSSTGLLTVTKAGTFIIAVRIASTTDDPSMSGVGTLIVEPAKVTISGITCVDRGVDDGSLEVEINTGGLLTGAYSSDDVQINYTNAYGLIDDENFAQDKTLTSTGENIFDVSVMSLALTGDDAHNYVLSSEPVATTVLVNMSLPFIAWPTATSVVFGNSNSHDDLYGGKVVVYETTTGLDEFGDDVVIYEGGAYTDITAYGQFEWVELTTAESAGTYEYEVKFVEDESLDHYNGEASYRAALDSMTHLVTQVVDAAAVTFTIESSILDAAKGEKPVITATDENGNELDASLYQLYYATDDVWDWDGNVPDFSVSGAYLIGAELLSENYHHAGTTVTTQKQIGAVTVYNSDAGDSKPTTYTTTLMIEDVVYKVFEGAISETIHVLPDLNTELDTDSYTGWYCEETGVTYNDLVVRFTQGDTDKTLTAIVAADKTATISGIITGIQVGSEQDEVELSGVAVALYQGNTLIGTYTTGGDGQYTFAVAPGVYNLVVTRDYNGAVYEITVFADVTEEDHVEDFHLSSLVQNAILTVATGMPALAVDGLTTLAETLGGTDSIEVNMSISGTTSADLDDIDAIRAVAYEAGLTDNDIKEFFNIDLSYTKDGGVSATPLTTLDDCLTFYLPLTGNYQDRDAYYVYRYHDNQVQELTMDATQEEYFELTDSYLILHAKNFSLYGIGFWDEVITTTTSSGGTSVTTYTNVLDAQENGSITSISPTKASKGIKVTFTITPDQGYTVSTVTATDASGNTVALTNNGDGTYSFTQPGSKVTLTATFALEGDGQDTGLPYTDVNTDHWFYDAVYYLYEMGLMTGTSETTFEPYIGNTRAMVAQIMYNLEGQPERTEFDFFSDVTTGDWYEEAVNWCATYGVVDGYPDGLYRPDQVITKEEFASILYDHCLHLDYDMSNLDDLSGFADAPSTWASTYVQWAVAQGIIQGDETGTLNATKALTRCEVASMLANFLQNVYESGE